MISKYQAIDIALDTIQGRNYIISGVYEELPELSRCNIYQNWPDQPAWYIFFRVDNPNLLCSTPIMIISKQTGQVLYDRHIGDEG